MNSFELNSTDDFQQRNFVDLMQQHNQETVPYSYDDQYSNQYFRQNLEETSSLLPPTNIEQDTNDSEDLPMPIAYKKRVRIKFTQEQLDILEATFQQHHYPTVDMVDELVDRLDLPTQKITVWFQNRRARLKKSQPKHDEGKIVQRDDPPQYDSGIHLDDDVSHESCHSPAAQMLPPLAVPATPMLSHQVPPTGPYYSSDCHIPFHPPLWSNFHYSLPMSSFPSAMSSHFHPFSSHSSEVFSPFVLHDRSHYQYQKEFGGDL